MILRLIDVSAIYPPGSRALQSQKLHHKKDKVNSFDLSVIEPIDAATLAVLQSHSWLHLAHKSEGQLMKTGIFHGSQVIVMGKKRFFSTRFFFQWKTFKMLVFIFLFFSKNVVFPLLRPPWCFLSKWKLFKKRLLLGSLHMYILSESISTLICKIVGYSLK